MRKLTEREKLLIELVHFLAYGDKLEFGLTLEEVFVYLQKPIPKRQNLNSLELLDRQGDKFIQELRDYLTENRR